MCGSAPQETARLPDICQNEDMPALRDGLPAISVPRVAGIFGSIIGIQLSVRCGTSAKKINSTHSVKVNGLDHGDLGLLGGREGSSSGGAGDDLGGALEAEGRGAGGQDAEGGGELHRWRKQKNGKYGKMARWQAKILALRLSSSRSNRIFETHEGQTCIIETFDSLDSTDSSCSKVES